MTDDFPKVERDILARADKWIERIAKAEGNKPYFSDLTYVLWYRLTGCLAWTGMTPQELEDDAGRSARGAALGLRPPGQRRGH